MKKLFLILGGAIILGALYYLLSPLWRNVELDEASPLAKEREESNPYIPPMDEKTKSEFMKKMDEMKDVTVDMDDAMPQAAAEEAKILGRAPFIARAHEVKGEALLIENGEKKTLRFENFETINGPDVRIYLAADLEAKDFVEISPIRATRGNVNYDIPAGVDTSRYAKVLVWCKAFDVLFSSAELR